MYTWYEHNPFNEFLLQSKDDLFVGIDWTAHKKRYEDFVNTNFFSSEFLDYYDSIAFKIDKFLKVSKQLNNQGLPNFIYDANSIKAKSLPDVSYIIAS